MSGRGVSLGDLILLWLITWVCTLPLILWWVVPTFGWPIGLTVALSLLVGLALLFGLGRVWQQGRQANLRPEGREVEG